MRATVGLVVSTVLAVSLTACGGNDDSGSGGSGDALTRYCSLVNDSTGAKLPDPPAGLLADPRPGPIRTWLRTALAPEVERTAKIVADAPSNVRPDWTQLRGAQKKLVDNLDAFLAPATFAGWQRLPAKQRASKFLGALLEPFADIDKDLVARLRREVKTDCGYDLGS